MCRPLLILTLILFIVAAGGCGKPQAKPTVQMTRDVSVTAAVEADVYPYQTAIAEVVAMSSVDIVSRIEGFLEKRHFVEGQTVKKGALLYSIEDSIYKAQLEVERGTLKAYEADLANKRLDLERQDRLMTQNATTEQERDHAKYAVEQAVGQLEAQKGAVALAERNLYYTKLYAPFDALTGFSAPSDGDLVNPASGTLVTLVSTGDVRVRFSLPEKALLNFLVVKEERDNEHDKVIEAIRKEIRVRLILPNGEYYPHDGTVEFFSNQVSRTMGTFTAEAVFNNSEGALIDGMNCKVRLERRAPLKALLIPSRAISKTQAGDMVIVVDSANITDLRIIKAGRVYNTATEVLGGLKPGERVITEGLLRASQRGLLVNPMEDINPAQHLVDTARAKN